MSAIQNKAVIVALNILNGLKAEYKVILPDGAEFGTLQVAKPEAPAPAKARKVSRTVREGRKYGELTTYFKPMIVNMQPGEVVNVPLNGFVMRSLASCMTAWACTNWGKGSVLTVQAGDHIEIMRIS